MISTKKLFSYFCSLVINLLFCFFYFQKETLFLFYLNAFTLILILINTNFSMFSLKHICITYILFPLFYQFSFGESYGLLEITRIPIYYNYINLTIYIYNLIWLLLFLSTNILDKERKKIESTEFIISNRFSLVLCVIAITSSIISFPSIPFFLQNNGRFSSLLPGHAWNHIAVVSLILLFFKLKNNKFVKFTYIFCILWFLLHFERVDMIGFIFGIIILYFVKNKSKIQKTKFLKYSFFSILIVAVFLFIGDFRASRSLSTFENYNFLKKIIVQSTSADEAYLYNISIDYFKNKNLLLFSPLLKYIYEVIPFINSPFGISNVLSKIYPYPGGEYILSLPIMSFGIIGIALFPIFEYILLKFIISKRGKYFDILYLLILCCSFRLCWYGFYYIETATLYIIIFILFLAKFKKDDLIYIGGLKNE